MLPERWQDIVEQVKKNFEVEDSGVEESDDNGGTTIEFIVFNGPLGRLRLEYETHPVILETKTHYSNRIGSETNIEYVYSDTETSNHLYVYRFDEAINDWVEFESPAFK